MRGFKKGITFELLIIIFIFLYLGFIYFSIAISNISLGIAVLLFLIGWFTKKIQLDFKRSRILLFLFVITPFLLTIFSVVHSDDVFNAMRSIRLRIPILIVSFMLVFMNLKIESIKKGINLFVILTVSATIFTLYKALTLLGEGILFQPDFTFFITPIQHPYFGIYLLIAFVSLIEFKSIENNVFRNIILIFLLSGIVISTSRLAYILLFFIILFYGFQLLSFKRSLLLGIFLILFSVIFISTNPDIQSKFQSSFNYQNSPRLKLWNNAIKVISNSDSRLLGIGIGDYYQTKEDPYFFKDKESDQYGYDPHSQLFDFYITTGYLGTFLLTIFFIWGIYHIYGQNKFSIILFFIILAFSLTESILNRQYGVQLYSVFIPLIFKDNFKQLK